LLQELLKNGNRQIVEKDVVGKYHFNGTFNNAESLKKALSQLPPQYESLVESDTELLLNTFEEIFDHKSFTGRSGTFFGYEGLGSIYWHMVSKLVLSIQETCLSAIAQGVDDRTLGRLLDHYYEAEEGIGVHKSPELYGAFPTDPYSHTPATKGAQQPGMTGQVKEDILCRFGELGVSVKDGRLMFDPRLLRKEEFLKAPESFRYIDANMMAKDIEVKEDSLCFTYCQIPIVYKLGSKGGMRVDFTDGNLREFSELSLDAVTSKKVFERTGEINQIIVSIIK
jgi:hypothetical protein